MDQIDITMPAVIRPFVVDQTLRSIYKNIVRGQHDRFRLIINVDPIGENLEPMTVVKIAKMYFKEVIYNIAKTPSLPKGVIWAWKQVYAPYVFHIEDDWIITRPIDVDHMIEILKKYQKLSSLRLYKYNMPNEKSVFTFGCKWNYNEDGFYLAKDWRKQFGLNPILIKKDFIVQAVPYMKDNINPEKQFRESQKYMLHVTRNWQYGIYSNPGDLVLAKDNGVGWRESNNFKKPDYESFQTWEKKK